MEEPEMKELLEQINNELSIWESEVAGEKLSGNVVKEALAQGHVMGFKIAHQIVSEYNQKDTAGPEALCVHDYVEIPAVACTKCGHVRR